MIDFQRVVPSDREKYLPYLFSAAHRGCAFSFANLCMWGHQRAAFLGDHLVIFSHYDGPTMYQFPICSGDVKPVLEQLRADARERGIPCRITCMTPAEVRELEQNLAACNDTSAITEEEKAGFQAIREQLGTQFCRRCNYCQPCSAGINISGCFLFAGYLNRYGLGDWAKGRYATLPVKASACIGCGACEDRCPYNLPIRQMLKQVAQDFGE